MELPNTLWIAKLNAGKRLRIVPPAVACLGALLIMSTAAYSQVPEPRVVASPGVADPFDPENVAEPVWETWVAADPNHVKIVHHQEVNASNNTATRIGYALLDRASVDRIAHGVLSPPAQQYGLSGSFDPSVVAANDGSGDFLACAILSRGPALSAEQAIGIARFSDGQWSAWTAMTEFGPAGAAYSYDKPWLMAGGLYNGEREYYITFWQDADIDPAISPARHRYLRSTDGGATWTLGDIALGIGGDVVEITAAGYQPTVVDDGPLYIAYTPFGSDREIRFLKGQDIDDPNDPHAGEVEFSVLTQVCPLGGGDGPVLPVPLVITRNRTSQEIQDMLPGGDSRMAFQSIPWLAADPNDPDQLYVVYHDPNTTESNDFDVNVYCQKLQRYSTGWCAGDRVKVNDGDNLPYEVDQFMPSVWVDHAGRVHIIYYDDRRYNVDSDQDEDTRFPRLDVYYAYSEDGGVHWFSSELAKDPNDTEPNETCLDYNLLDGFDFSTKPGDYNGIAVYGDTVWTSFTGTSADELEGDPDSNPSVIWSCRIQF